MRPTVAAIVVTFNRKGLVAECLDALVRQTHPLTRIVLVDNGSSDGTFEYLKDRGFLDNRIIDYVRVDVNAGGSAGFSIGVEKGFREGYEWLWLMDDDAEPRTDALEKLAGFFETPKESSALASVVVDQDGRQVPYHRGRFNFSNPFKPLVTSIEPREDERCAEIDHASFVGICVRRTAVTAVGLPERRFFIHLDDLEYCERLRRHGRILLIQDSVVVHKEAARENKFVERKFGWLRSERVAYDKLWLQYFVRRNSVYFMKRHAKNRVAFWVWLALTLTRSSLGILIFDDFKSRRLLFVLNAATDGLGGIFDNEKPKKLLYG